MSEYQASRQRIIGDPGLTEHFALPQYAYVFITRMDGVNEVVWQRMEVDLDENEWRFGRYGGSLSSSGDSIYEYNQPIQILLQNNRPQGNVYAICSNVALTFSQNLEDVTTKAAILNLKFDTSDEDIQQNLQNIYATPYNYNIGGGYYCSYDCTLGKVIRVNMLMYHIASKVDLNWTVAEDKRINTVDPSQAVRLTYMQARRLFNGYAYCFMPLRNTMAELPSSGGYDISIISNGDEGLWWEGRSYFYTIPYTVVNHADYFPLQLLMRTNGSTEGSGYELTINQPIDTTAVFVPWLRGNFIFNNPLENKRETKTGS